MPASYTHQILAEKIFEALPENIKAMIPFSSEYFLGAQGGDVWYFHKIPGSRHRLNLGKYFHRHNVYEVFCSLLKSAAKGGVAASYAAGYVTHYAGDTVFHPYVYFMVEKYKRCKNGWKGNRHALMESDFDTYFVRKYKDLPVGEYHFPVRYDHLDLAALYPVVASASEDTGGDSKISASSVRHAVRRFLRFQRFFADRHYRRRKILYGAESVFHAKHILSGLCRRENPEPAYFNQDREEWHYPADASQTSRVSVDQLFDRAVREGVRLVCEFFICMEGGKPLPREDFSKHFLTGVSLPAEERNADTERAGGA